MSSKKTIRALLVVASVLVVVFVLVGYLFVQKQGTRSLADQRFQRVGSSLGYSYVNGNTTHSENGYFVGALNVEKTPDCPGSPYLIGLVFKEENGKLVAHVAQLDAKKFTVVSITPDNDSSSTYDPCFVRTVQLANSE